MLMNLSVIEKIDKYGLCLGCGLCESVFGKENLEMRLGEDGFFHPKIKNHDEEKEKIIQKTCPGLNIINDIPFEKNEMVWGHIEQLSAGYSLDQEIRTKGSSGGIVSAIGIFMLESGKADAVLQIGGDAADYLRNQLQVSKTREEVLRCASSKYAPALVFNNILKLFEENEDRYCFIGKPCDISALKNILAEYPQYSARIVLTVSIMCAGIPSFIGTKAIITDFHAKEPVHNLSYRGGGWPGYFTFTDSLKKTFKRTYNDSWGKTLNQHLHFRCKVCPEGIGIQADIAVGDAWETKDGYPDFTEKEGVSLVIARTLRGKDLLSESEKMRKMSFVPQKIQSLRLMQPYQYTRRTRAASRRFAFFLATGVKLNFRNLRLYETLWLTKKHLILKDAWGTFKRVIKFRRR
ncbi:coenzyme F420 hydrogenase subunit beta [bacterium A37T11]|nr:coenzyme F420 hydrogenase subunit beta [bacterium A37T11]